MPAKYDDCEWDELPANMRKAAEVLGYDKHIWDTNGACPCDDLDWYVCRGRFGIRGLHVFLLRLTRLGSHLVVAVCFYTWVEDRAELTPAQQEAAGKLGYTPHEWDEDDGGATKYYEDYDWDDLPGEVQEAAKILGYDKKKWDTNAEVPVDNKDWEKLSRVQKAAAITLGYNENSWDD